MRHLHAGGAVGIAGFVLGQYVDAATRARHPFRCLQGATTTDIDGSAVVQRHVVTGNGDGLGRRRGQWRNRKAGSAGIVPVQAIGGAAIGYRFAIERHRREAAGAERDTLRGDQRPTVNNKAEGGLRGTGVLYPNDEVAGRHPDRTVLDDVVRIQQQAAARRQRCAGGAVAEDGKRGAERLALGVGQARRVGVDCEGVIGDRVKLGRLQGDVAGAEEGTGKHAGVGVFKVDGFVEADGVAGGEVAVGPALQIDLTAKIHEIGVDVQGAVTRHRAVFGHRYAYKAGNFYIGRADLYRAIARVVGTGADVGQVLAARW